MNTLEKSLALAKAWLTNVDDKTFYSEYQQIKKYSDVGPTVDYFIKNLSKNELISDGFYVTPINSIDSLNTVYFEHNLIISAGYPSANSAVNDENYALAA
ncbi:hypothetical protein [Providencia sp. PROV124]|uniref:hypothetical protein n=1 Tax=Providencia sp. PROV124 TaxID=2949835 RepID=UPI00234BCF6C|nr:hypothetical protein [Providencia sp. PROV124]